MIFLVGIAQLGAKEATRHRLLSPDLEKGYIPQEEHRRYVRELDLEHAAKIDQLACEHDTGFRQLRDECRKVERERDLSRQEFLRVNEDWMNIVVDYEDMAAKLASLEAGWWVCPRK
jgi:hypothetical protein